MRTRTYLLVICGSVALLAFMLAGCPTSTTPSNTGVTGSATAGQAEFSQTCAACHTASALVGFQNRITNNMGTISPAMAGITLTDQQVADLQAFIATQ